MGRRSFWYFLGNDNFDAHEKLRKVMHRIKEHNFHVESIPDKKTGELIERGEDIDSAYYQTFKGKEGIWLCFYSPGGDWATETYFETRYPKFYKKLLRYNEFEKLKDYHSNKDLWEYKEIDMDQFGVYTLLRKNNKYS